MENRVRSISLARRLNYRLLRQTDFPHQFGKTGIGTQRIELEVSVQTHQQPVVFAICRVEPLESVLLVAQVGIQAGNLQRRLVPGFAPVLPQLNRLRERALPSFRAKSPVQRGGIFQIVSIAGKLGITLPFFDDLRIHTLPQ